MDRAVARDAGRPRAEDRQAAAGLCGPRGARLRPDRRAGLDLETQKRNAQPIPQYSTLQRPRAILFDWDGTLLDSAETSYRCYRRLFAPYGIDFTRDVFARTYAPDWYRTYEGIGLSREYWAEADARWLEIYAEETGETCGLVPGAREALARIGAAGVLAALVTSGSRVRIEGEIAKFGLAATFAAVVCGEDALHKKPHPEALLKALDRLGIAAADAVYVGDSPEDIQMARAAGVRAVGVVGAFPNAAALRESGPDVLARDLAEAADGLLGEG
jgi:phosphoglycolate phosphatase